MVFPALNRTRGLRLRRPTLLSTQATGKWWRIAVSRRALPGAGRACHVLSLIPPNGTPARTFTRIFDVRSVALCFKLRGHKVDARLGLPPSKIYFADRRFGSLPCERNGAVSRSCAYRDHEGHLFYRQRPRCYGTITA